MMITTVMTKKKTYIHACLHAGTAVVVDSAMTTRVGQCRKKDDSPQRRTW